MCFFRIYSNNQALQLVYSMPPAIYDIYIYFLLRPFLACFSLFSSLCDTFIVCAVYVFIWPYIAPCVLRPVLAYFRRFLLYGMVYTFPVGKRLVRPVLSLVYSLCSCPGYGRAAGLYILLFRYAYYIPLFIPALYGNENRTKTTNPTKIVGIAYFCSLSFYMHYDKNSIHHIVQSASFLSFAWLSVPPEGSVPSGLSVLYTAASPCVRKLSILLYGFPSFILSDNIWFAVLQLMIGIFGSNPSLGSLPYSTTAEGLRISSISA